MILPNKNSEDIIKLYPKKFKLFVLTHPKYLDENITMEIVIKDFKKFLIKKK